MNDWLTELNCLSDHQLAVWTLIFAALSLLGAIVANIIALIAIGRSNKNSSVATFVMLNDGFRQGWCRFLDADTDSQKQYELSELMNLIEVACGVHQEGSIVGVSKNLSEDYLLNILRLLASNAESKQRIKHMMSSPTTFEFVRAFIESLPRYDSRAELQLLRQAFS